MSVTTKTKTNLGTRLMFNFHIMEDMAQLLHRRVRVDPESL